MSECWLVCGECKRHFKIADDNSDWFVEGNRVRCDSCAKKENEINQEKQDE